VGDFKSGNFVLKPVDPSTKTQKKKPGMSQSLRSQLAVTLENHRSKIDPHDDDQNDDTDTDWV